MGGWNIPDEGSPESFMSCPLSKGWKVEHSFTRQHQWFTYSGLMATAREEVSNWTLL